MPTPTPQHSNPGPATGVASGEVPGHPAVTVLRRCQKMAAVIDPIAHDSLQDVKLGGVLRDLLHVLRIQGVVLPADLGVLIKTLIVCEATTDELDPTLNMHSFLAVLGTLSSTGTTPT